MTNAASDDLTRRLKEKRAQVDTFIAGAVPRRRRLLNTTIVGGTLSAALTAGPAAGGTTFTAWLTHAAGLSGPSWQLLCGLAAVCSIAATLATQLLKSNNLEEKVTRAQGCRAKLEVLEVGLATGQLDQPRAAAEYLKCVEEVAFL